MLVRTNSSPELIDPIFEHIQIYPSPLLELGDELTSIVELVPKN